MPDVISTTFDGPIARLAFGPGHATADLRLALGHVLAHPECAVVALEIEPAGDAYRDADNVEWLELFDLPIVASFEHEITGTSAAVALACDIRVCSGEASIVMPVASYRRIRRLLRDDEAIERATAGGHFSAEEAFEVGLVSTVTPAGQASNEALRLAGVMAKRGPIALRLGKEAIWRGLEMPLAQALRFETDLTLLLQTTKDRAEGVRAFIEKREPRFTGD